MAERGTPQAIRCDNGPELTSRHFLAWCIEQKIELVHIQPGRPMQNRHVESFNGRMRDECLNESWFGNLFRGASKDRGVAVRIQRRAAAQQPGISDAGGIRAGSGRGEGLRKRRCVEK